MPEEAAELKSPQRLYEITGIQKQSYNTFFQLYRDKKSEKLDTDADFLPISEHLSYKRTGVKKCTNTPFAQPRVC